MGSARLLAEITGREFGSPDDASDTLALAVLAARWRSWYDQNTQHR